MPTRSFDLVNAAEVAERCPVHRALTQGTGFDGVTLEPAE